MCARKISLHRLRDESSVSAYISTFERQTLTQGSGDAGTDKETHSGVVVVAVNPR